MNEWGCGLYGSAGNLLTLVSLSHKNTVVRVIWGGTSYIRMIGMIVVFFRGCSSKFLYLLGYKNRYFEYASLINSGLLVFFKLSFDQ